MFEFEGSNGLPSKQEIFIFGTELRELVIGERDREVERQNTEHEAEFEQAVQLRGDTGRETHKERISSIIHIRI